MTRHRVLWITLFLALAVWLTMPWLRMALNLLEQRMTGPKTIEDRLIQYGTVVEQRLAPAFARVGLTFPPERVLLLGLKRERRLEVLVATASGPWHVLCAYPILAASGVNGPKLREGDRQVPEGLYRIESLNPNSRFHLALRVNYPNEFDRAQALRAGRDNLGGDIMIHGNQVSIGCLAMGDEAAEDLFVLAARTGLPNIRVLLAPCDLRTEGLPPPADGDPAWLSELYKELQAEMKILPEMAR